MKSKTNSLQSLPAQGMTLFAATVFLLLIFQTPNIARAQVSTQPGVVKPVLPKVNQNCMSFLQGYVDWMLNKPANENRSISFVLVSNQHNQVVGYTVGELTWHPPQNALLSGSFVGEGTQYFNDRLWGCPPPAGSDLLSIESNPFSPNKTDKLGVEIVFKTGRVNLTLKSWGNSKVAFDCTCANGVMYGFQNTTAAMKTLFVLSLKKISNPVVK